MENKDCNSLGSDFTRKTFTVPNQSAKTVKLFHLEQFTIYSSNSMSVDLKYAYQVPLEGDCKWYAYHHLNVSSQLVLEL